MSKQSDLGLRVTRVSQMARSLTVFHAPVTSSSAAPYSPMCSGERLRQTSGVQVESTVMSFSQSKFESIGAFKLVPGLVSSTLQYVLHLNGTHT